MKYKELLELYKQGKLEEEKRKKVEQDIEKHEAIGEYLFENDGIPEFSDFDVQSEGDAQEDSDEKRFTKNGRKSASISK